MLEKLTKKQEKIMHETREEWLAYAFDWKKSTFDKEKAIEGVKWLYEISNLPTPKSIYVVESPLAAQILLNESSLVGNQVRNQVWDQVRNQVGNQVWNQVGNQVRNQVGNQVGNQVRNQVWDQVRNQVGNQVRNQVGNQKNANFYNFTWCFFADYCWISFYSFFEKIGLLKAEKFSKYQNIIKNKIWDVILLSEVAVIVKAPIQVSFNSEKRLHNEKEGAVKWGDSYENYFLNGVSIEKELFVKVRDRKISGKEILQLKNVEQKRVIIEIVGWSYVLSETESKTIDKKQGYELIECDLADDENKKARFVKVKDSSTDREYFLRVEPSISDAVEAVAWTFEQSKENYKLEKET